MEKAGDILRSILKDTDLSKAEKACSLYTAWERIAGEPLSHHTRVADIIGRKLVIEVEHPGWHQMLRFKEKAILRRVQREYPSLEVRGMRIRFHGEGQSAAETQKNMRKQSAEPREQENLGSPSLRHIEDEKLRKSLQSLYRGIIRKDRQGKASDP